MIHVIVIVELDKFGNDFHIYDAVICEVFDGFGNVLYVKGNFLIVGLLAVGLAGITGIGSF